MLSLQRHLFPPATIEGAAGALGIYERPVDAYIRSIYTSQQGAEWKFCMGCCVLGTDAGGDAREDYPNIVFVSRAFHGFILKGLLEQLASEGGFALAPGLPSLRLPKTPFNWREEIVPSHATTTGMPARRFKVGIEVNAVFNESALVAYREAYRPSAERHAKAFLRLPARDGLDRGEFMVEVPDKRGAISFREGRISIAGAAIPLRLVGEVNGRVIDLEGDRIAQVDAKAVRDVELWLLTESNELIDYASTSQWQYRYPITLGEAAREDELLALINGGESEVCEFKSYVDLANQKALELEKTVCAFSNQRGGTLFIGVSDDGDIEGLAGDLARRGEAVDVAVAGYADDVRKRLRETLKDNQCFSLGVAKVADTPLVIVTVATSPDVNFLVKTRTAYIRHGGSSMKLTAQELKAMIQSSGRSPFG